MSLQQLQYIDNEKKQSLRDALQEQNPKFPARLFIHRGMTKDFLETFLLSISIFTVNTEYGLENEHRRDISKNYNKFKGALEDFVEEVQSVKEGDDLKPNALSKIMQKSLITRYLYELRCVYTGLLYIRHWDNHHSISVSGQQHRTNDEGIYRIGR